jgi:hypothetical protein
VCPGNHESAYNFLHYTTRFDNQPINTGVLPAKAGEEVAGKPNNWWFSYNMGNAHFVSISTEVWFYTQQQEVLGDMLAWLKQDLMAANQNRSEAPWLIVFGHRSMYCSCDGDCDGGAATVKDDLEELFYQQGVDLFINGHEHNYERLYSVYNETYMAGNGSQVTNPPATTYVVTGDAGNSEGHEPFTRPQPTWSAFRGNVFGYSRMVIHNDTHLYWEQVQTDSGEPLADMGKIIDYMWLEQHNHGPFHVSPNRRQQHAESIPHVEYLSRMTGKDGANIKHTQH